MNSLFNMKIHAQNILNIKTNEIVLVFVKKKINLIRNEMLTDVLVF